jgi:hypothetical protein
VIATPNFYKQRSHRCRTDYHRSLEPEFVPELERIDMKCRVHARVPRRNITARFIYNSCPAFEPTVARRVLNVATGCENIYLRRDGSCSD